MKKLNKKDVIPFVACALVLCMLSLGFGGEIQLPRISIEELRALMESGADILIIDTQPKKMYEFGHIKGAISLPYSRRIDPVSDWVAAQKLPRDKQIITYCDCGPGEQDSNNLGNQLRALGFMRVKVLADPSIAAWIEKGYPIER
jgi:rhodanese-related sulfurtransferase